MGVKINYDQMNAILAKLSENYTVYAPCLNPRKGDVRFTAVQKISDIVLDKQSDYSCKDAFYPISQVMFYFKDDTVVESELKLEKDILIIGRPCDINGVKRLDKIFLENGNKADFFYKRMRDHVKFILLECKEGFDDCFCVSVGSNKTDDYVAALRINEDNVEVLVKDPAFDNYFTGDACDFEPEFVQENKKSLEVPQITSENLKAVSDLEFWKRYDDTCIACGGCNTVCGTCSCFDTVDVTYVEGSTNGERRRVWGSCMLEDFTRTAGGAVSRKTHGANMRFKVFHKFFDFKKRFGTDFHMCVGCGRCNTKCPKQISFFDTVKDLGEEIKNMNSGKEA